MILSEAKHILSNLVKELRSMPFNELNRFKGSKNPVVKEVRGESGKEYLLEYFSFIEDKEKQHLRVVVSVSFDKSKSISDDFIIDSNNYFISE